MAKFRIQSPDGKAYDIEAPDGATPDQLNAFVTEHVIKPNSSPQVIGKGEASSGGVMGGIGKGITDAVDAGAQLLRRAVPDSVGNAVDNFGNQLADMGLPIARSNGVEGVDNLVKQRNADYEASRKLAGREGLDFARVGGNLLNPVNYVVPAGGAATVGNIALRAGTQGALSGALTPVTEEGDFGSQKAGQVGLGAALGAGGGVLIQKIVNGVGSIINRLRSSSVDSNAIESAIKKAATEQGIDPAALTPDVMDSVRATLAKSSNIDPKAALRLAEGEKVLGPSNNLTVGQATRDAGQFTREMNLSKVGANGGAGSNLTERLAGQNNALMGAMNDMGAANAPGTYKAGQNIVNALSAADQKAQANVKGLYDQAKALNAGDLPLNASDLAKKVDSSLKTIQRDEFLPTSVKNIVSKIESGEKKLTIDTTEQFKSIIGQEIAKYQRAGDGATVQALHAAREVFDNLAPEAGVAGEAAAAYNTARSAARSRFVDIENNPALKAVLDGVQPDDFFRQFVINGKANDLAKVIQTAPEAKETIRQQIASHLLSKANGGSADDVAKFSQSAYNKALNGLDEEKLASVFTKSEIENLRRIGRVAAYAQSQPAGAAVNNSNTAAAVQKILENPLTRKIPVVGEFANMLANSAKDMQNKAFARNALSGNLPTNAIPKQPGRYNPLLNPGAIPSIYIGTAE